MRACSQALPQLKDVPSVIYGTANFDPETRRVVDPQFVNLQVVDGAFVPWDGEKPAVAVDAACRQRWLDGSSTPFERTSLWLHAAGVSLILRATSVPDRAMN